MLNPDCERFRDLFEPRAGSGSELEHRRACAGCDRWAARLEAVARCEVRRPLPAVLQSRLIDIPRSEVRCADVDRLYETIWQEAWQGRSDDHAALRHLAECRRCRRLYETLRVSFGRTLGLPPALAGRLRSLRRRTATAVPWWIRQARFGVAACWLLTVLLTSLAGNAEALFKGTALLDTTESVSSTASMLATEGGERGRELLVSVSDRVEHGWMRSRTALLRHGETYEHLLVGARKLFDSISTDNPEDNLQGEPENGRSGNDAR